MVHRTPNVSDALRRMWRSISQNAASVFVLAAAPVVVSAGSDGADLATVGTLAVQAGGAAVLAYIYNLIWPQAGGRIPEAPARAGRSLVQNLLSGLVVAGASAVLDVAGSGDLKTMGWMAVQAIVASALAFGHNWLRPMKKVGPEDSGAEVPAGAGGDDGSASSLGV